MSFSTDPDIYLRDALNKGYVGARIEQGVPVLDRDLNLLGDLPLAMLRTLTADFIGDGVREGNEAFRIVAADADNDFEISGPGVLVVDGLQIRIPAPLRYSAQSTTPLTTPAGVREDHVYLDVLTEPTLVDQTDDTDLENRGDVGQQTSVRLMASWQVRVAEGGPIPPEPPGHRHIRLARLARAAGVARIVDIADLRPLLKTLHTVSERITELESIRTRVDDPVDGLDALVRRVEDLEEKITRLQRVQMGYVTTGEPWTATLGAGPVERVLVFGLIHRRNQAASVFDAPVVGYATTSGSRGIGSKGSSRYVVPTTAGVWARWNNDADPDTAAPHHVLEVSISPGSIRLTLNGSGDLASNRYTAQLMIWAL